MVAAILFGVTLVLAKRAEGKKEGEKGGDCEVEGEDLDEKKEHLLQEGETAVTVT